MTQKRVRQVEIQTREHERLLIVPVMGDTVVSIYRQDRLDENDDWTTDPDAGLCIERKHLADVIQALQDIRDGLRPTPKRSTDR